MFNIVNYQCHPINDYLNGASCDPQSLTRIINDPIPPATHPATLRESRTTVRFTYTKFLCGDYPDFQMNDDSRRLNYCLTQGAVVRI